MGVPLALFGSIGAIRARRDESLAWLALGLVTIAVMIILWMTFGSIGAS